MYLKELPTLTLSEFADQVNDTSESNQVAGTDVTLDLTDSRTISFGPVEVPATPEGIEALGRHLKVPGSFLFPKDRQADAEEQQYVLSRRLQRLGNTVAIHHTPTGIQGVYAAGASPINPRRVVEVAMRVMDPASQIIEFTANNDEMFFDVAVPLDTVTTGDPSALVYDPRQDAQVGDLTAAGLRFHQNRARNLTPTVDEFAFRLVCTNGMSLPDSTLPKVDARKVETVEEVMALLEVRAQEAFGRVEQQIAHFYDLRNQVVAQPEQALFRMGGEYGLPDSTVNRLARLVPAMREQGDVTMFDIVNLVTNEANNPAVSTSGRRALEQAGGRVVSVHAERCTHCQSSLG